MLRTGAVLHGTYRIDDYLSSGGFGNTYVVTHTHFNEKYALKEFFMKGVSERDGNNTTVSVSNTEKVAEFNEQLEKFKKEARRLRKLNNKHIVKVHDLFEENGTAYYVMDYIDGENLKERLARTHQPMNEAEVTDVLRQILDALREVHAQGLWHLDLKPANIMVDRNGTVKLIDFGASKQFNNKTGGALSTSAVTFTNGYAPLEQMERSYEKFGPWTDFYALGATLYNLLANQKPPMPSDINDDLSPDKHLALPLPANVSQRMRDLLLWLMKTNRLERPASVDDIITVLDEVKIPQHDDDVTVLEEQLPPEPVPTVYGTPPIDGEEEPQPSKKNFKMAFIAGAVGLFLFAAFGIFSRGCSDALEPTVEVVDSAAVEQKVLDAKLTIPMGECSYTGVVNADGMPDGRGVATFKNGDKVTGTFVNGNVDGPNGRYDFADGDSFEGTFKNNEFYDGRYYLTKDGTYFQGTFKNNSPASGQWYDINGKKIK